MKAVIIEDEPLVTRSLQKLLGQVVPEMQVSATLESVESSVNFFRQHSEPDLIFADIQLSDGVSFDIFQKVQVNCPIIFTTAYDEYAIRAFKLNSIDYLLKPIDRQELERALQKFSRWQGTGSGLFREQLQQMMSDLGGSKKVHKERFLAHVGRGLAPVAAEQVAYFLKDELIFLVTTGNDKLLTDYHSLEELEELLNPKEFFRANRQHIININSIGSFRTHYTGKVPVTLKQPLNYEFTVSREKAQAFKEWFE